MRVNDLMHMRATTERSFENAMLLMLVNDPFYDTSHDAHLPPLTMPYVTTHLRRRCHRQLQ